MVKNTTYLILLLFVLCSVANAQIPDYFSNNPEWRISHQLDSQYPCVEYTDYVTYLNGDSIIANNTYKKVFKRGIIDYMYYGQPPNDPNFSCYGTDSFNEYQGLVRQDSMSIYQWDGNKDTLLMNFNLTIGDTINDWSLYNSSGWVITSMDSVEINADYYLVFYAKSGTADSTVIVEGVGTGAGFLERMPTFFEDDSNLSCYAQNGNTEWVNNLYQGACNFDVGLNSFSKIDMLVYPNPSQSFFTVELETSEHVQYKILSLEGKLISEGRFNGENIIGHNLNKGTYFLRIMTSSGIAMRKIIKY